MELKRKFGVGVVLGIFVVFFLLLPPDVSADYCSGNVYSGYAYCPDCTPENQVGCTTNNWYCINQYVNTNYNCASYLTRAACESVPITSRATCTRVVDVCQRCSWITTGGATPTPPGGGGGGTYTPVNCSSLRVNGILVNSSSPINIEVGDRLTLDASYSSVKDPDYATHYLVITEGTNACNKIKQIYWGFTGTTGGEPDILKKSKVDLSWTPAATGTYTISCAEQQNWDGYGECWWEPCSDGDNFIYGGNYRCTGPNNYVTVNVGSPATPTPTPTPTPIPIPSGPWWQVIDGDVQSNGDLNSDIPSGDYFNLAVLTDFPGVVKYSGSTNLFTSNVSVKGWLADSSFSPPNGRIQNYSYFKRLMPSESEINLNQITEPSGVISGSYFNNNGVISDDGYYWYEFDGAAVGQPLLRIDSDISFSGGKKVILFVSSADLSIEGDIDYVSGEDVFVVLVNGDIGIDGDVTDLMGFYLADGNISTGSSSNTLNLKGAVVSYGSLIPQRLGASNVPSEVFEYDAASAFLFPSALSTIKTRWREVAP